MNNIKILLVEDQKLMRIGIKSLFSDYPEMEIARLLYTIQSLAVVEEFMRHRDSAYSEGAIVYGGKSLGNCPNCGKPVVDGKYGPFCTGRCGLSLGRAFGKQLTALQTEKLLAGKTVLIKGFKTKTGASFAAKLTVEGTEPYEYEKD